MVGRFGEFMWTGYGVWTRSEEGLRAFLNERRRPRRSNQRAQESKGSEGTVRRLADRVLAMAFRVVIAVLVAATLAWLVAELV